MNKQTLEAFDKCTITTLRTGMPSLEPLGIACVKGLWAVSGSNILKVGFDAYNLFNKNATDGAYNDLLNIEPENVIRHDFKK